MTDPTVPDDPQQPPQAPPWGAPADPAGPSSYVPPASEAPGTPPPGYQAPGYQAPGYAAPGYPPPTSGTPPQVGFPAPQGGYPASGYGAPQPGGYSAPGYGGQAEHPQGTTILVLGILSIVVCGILGPFAWSMGSKALREIDANPGYYRNRGNVQAGRILGIIGTVLLGLGVLWVLFVVVLAAGTTRTTY